MRVYQKTKIYLLLVFPAALFVTALALGCAGIVKADNVVEGFTSSQPIPPGEIVSVDDLSKKTVKPTPANGAATIYGVAVDPSDAPIALVNQDSKIFVATTGTYQVLVSVSNGVIHAGDYISMSSVNGIGAKAQPGQALVLGRAASSFDGSHNVVTANNNKNIGRVYVNIAVAKNPISSSDPTLPSFLRKVAYGLANKSVPVIRVYTAVLIFFISLAASMTVLYSGVRSSLIAIGRNPLSKKVIFSAMYKTLFTGLGVFIIGMAGVYLLLKI